MSSASPRDKGCTPESPAITSGSTATVAGSGGARASSASRASACRAARSAAARGEGRSESKLDGGVLGLLPRLARERGNVGGRDCRGLRCASARDGGAQQQKRERPLHRRDFFLAAFFLTSGLGLAARTGLTLDLRGTSMSERTRSPSSGPIKPRRTA